MNHHFFFISLILIYLISPAYAQILNAGFENWTNGTPDDWLTNDYSGINPVTQSTSRHSGSFAVKGTTISTGVREVIPVLLAGADGNGFAINTRPEALHGFYVFMPAAFSRDSLVISMTVSKQDTVIGMDTLLIGNGTDSYQEFVANIHYIASGIPDLINISVTMGGYTAYSGTYFLLDDLSFGPAVGVNEPRLKLPTSFELLQNYPNPFNPSTVINYQLPVRSAAILSVYNVLGQEVATLANSVQEPGYKSVVWNASNVPSGIYFYRLQAGKFTDIKKMLLLK